MTFKLNTRHIYTAPLRLATTVGSENISQDVKMKEEGSENELEQSEGLGKEKKEEFGELAEEQGDGDDDDDNENSPTPVVTTQQASSLTDDTSLTCPSPSPASPSPRRSSRARAHVFYHETALGRSAAYQTIDFSQFIHRATTSDDDDDDDDDESEGSHGASEDVSSEEDSPTSRSRVGRSRIGNTCSSSSNRNRAVTQGQCDECESEMKYTGRVKRFVLKHGGDIVINSHVWVRDL